MKATWEKIEKNVGTLQVEVEPEQVASALDRAFKKVVRQVNVPGFRKGKVPRALFEARFGVESLYQEAIDILLPEAYTAAVEETGIEPIDRPEIDVQEFAKNEPFKFSAKVQVKPEVTLGDYMGIEVPEQAVEVNQDEIEAELHRMQERNAELIVVEEGPAQNGDVAIIDFEGFIDDVPFEGGKGERHSLELGSGSFIPGFEEQVEGMAIGEAKDVHVTFPETYQAEQLKGKAAVFKVVLHELKRKVLPELDDEFAKDVSEHDTLDEYRAEIEQKLKERKQREAASAKESAVVEKAAEAAEVDIPDVMVETEIDHMLKEFEQNLRSQGMNLDMYFQFSGQTEEAMRSQMSEDAKKRVKQTLVLEAIAAAEQVKASEEDLEQELEKIAKAYRMTAEEVKNAFEQNGTIQSLEKDLAIQKTVQLLVDNSKPAPEIVA